MFAPADFYHRLTGADGVLLADFFDVGAALLDLPLNLGPPFFGRLSFGNLAGDFFGAFCGILFRNAGDFDSLWAKPVNDGFIECLAGAAPLDFGVIFAPVPGVVVGILFCALGLLLEVGGDLGQVFYRGGCDLCVFGVPGIRFCRILAVVAEGAQGPEVGVVFAGAELPGLGDAVQGIVCTQPSRITGGVLDKIQAVVAFGIGVADLDDISGFHGLVLL